VPQQTTLHGASGSTTTQPPIKRRSPAVAAAGIMVLLGGVGAATYFATRGGDKPAAVRDAAAVATTGSAVLPPDAAPLAPTPADATLDPEIADMQALAATKDWAAMLTLAKHHADDPAIAPQIATAKQAYTAQQTETIAEYAKRGDCGSAKSTAKVAAELVPENAAAFDKAATCAAKPKPAQASLADQASDAYDAEQYAKALQLAQQALQKNPKDVDALRVAARAACQTKDAALAQKLIAQLAPADRKAPVLVCQVNKVALAKPPEPPKPPGDTTPKPPDKPPANPVEVKKALDAAKAAQASTNWPNAFAEANKVLAVQPANRDALRIAGIAACKMHQPQVAMKIAENAPPVVQMRIRRACSNAPALPNDKDE
jgi:hypothetical protein